MKTGKTVSGVIKSRIQRLAYLLLAMLTLIAGHPGISSATTLESVAGIRGMTRGEDGRMILRIVPAGEEGEFLDIFMSDSLTNPDWQLAGAYLRVDEGSELSWEEPLEPDTERPRTRFFRIGRADIDRNENGIPDDRETLYHIHDLPAHDRARWARAGRPDPPEDFTHVLNVKNSGARGDGIADDAPAIQRVMDEAPSGSVVYLPAGIYRLTQALYLKSDMILRGDGAALTSLLLEGAGTAGRGIGMIRWDGHQSTTYVTPTAGMEFGSTELTVSSVEDFQPGDIIEIDEENDPAWNLNDAWQERLPGQINRITALDPSTSRLTLDRPLRHTFSAQRNPRLRRLYTLENSGIEDLYIERKDAINGYTIEMKFAVRCWVRNVESRMTYKAHVWMDRSYECEVRQSYFHDSHVFGGGGQGYGVGCGKRTSDCLVEDNVFRHLRHSMIVGIGANGNVFGYNYSTQRAIDPVYGTPQPDISVHGNYVFMNLFEGNILEDADVPDWYWPAGPGNTLFRNRIVNSATAIDVGSDYQNFIGNVLTRGTLTQALSLQGVVDYGNVKYGDTGNISWPDCSCQTLADSFYRSVPPAFILEDENVSWPPIGPKTPQDSAIPASRRFSSGDLP